MCTNMSIGTAPIPVPTHTHTLIEIRNVQYVLLIPKRQKSRLCGCQLELNTKCEVGKKATTTITVRHVFLSRFFFGIANEN